MPLSERLSMTEKEQQKIKQLLDSLNIFTEVTQHKLRQFLDDLNLFTETITELRGKMTSEYGKAFIDEFIESVMPEVEQMKADLKDV